MGHTCDHIPGSAWDIHVIISLGVGVQGLAIGPDDNLYVASFLLRHIVRYELSTGRYLGQFAPPPDAYRAASIPNGGLAPKRAPAPTFCGARE